jgi:hypothetical protein
MPEKLLPQKLRFDSTTKSLKFCEPNHTNAKRKRTDAPFCDPARAVGCVRIRPQAMG